MDKFAPLRAMESFSENMFNRIFEFQQKLHPAWDPTLPFVERIKGLPLHYLVFSNGDRDPARQGSTVAPYYPLREELRTIAWYANQVAAQPVVCDLHARNGFIGSLLAREHLRVIGLRDPADKPPQIPNFYDPDVYEMRQGREIDVAFDVAFSSWMPGGQNVTPEILTHEPKLIVYIHTEHVDAISGQAQTGTPEAYAGLSERYRLIEQWSITRPADLLHAVWPDLSPNIEETRHVKIFADRPWHGLEPVAETPPVTPYDWEAELDMALLAREAKAELLALGYRL